MDEHVQPANRGVMGGVVSVIIPTYNRAAIVSRAVESTLSQTHPPIEVIIVDDGSTDETLAVLARYGDKIKLISIVHGGHPGISRNVAIRAAIGDYIAFLDDDDEWLPTKLEEQIAALERFPNAKYVSTNAFRQLPTGERRLYFPNAAVLSGLLFNELLHENFIIASTMLVKREILEQAGDFNEKAWSRGIEDNDLWLRIAAIAQGVFLPDALAVYYDNPSTSIRKTYTLFNYWLALYKSLLRTEKIIRPNPVLHKASRDVLLDRKFTYLNLAAQEVRQTKYVFHWLYCKVILVVLKSQIILHL
jgi:glycosyltransferase involved in cell wall biosynthesis